MKTDGFGKTIWSTVTAVFTICTVFKNLKCSECWTENIPSDGGDNPQN